MGTRTATTVPPPARALEAIVAENIKASLEVKQAMLRDADLLTKIAEAGQLLAEALGRGQRAFLAGNGGSAADSQHIAAELVGRYKLERKGLPVLALTVNTSCLTAIGNDYSYEAVFARQVEALASEGDVVIGISTSGHSKNIVSALRTARQIGASTIAMSGRKGGRICQFADVSLCVPSEDTPRIQEAHIVMGHILSEIVETALFRNG